MPSGPRPPGVGLAVARPEGGSAIPFAAPAAPPLAAYRDIVAKLRPLQRRVPSRTQHELDLQMNLGPALMALKGWSAPEVEQAYARA